ncbi:hypothetical protein MRX96_019206 [Rhipicephalus microplus]
MEKKCCIDNCRTNSGKIAYLWKTFICGHCLSEFDTFSDLTSHITSIGSAKKYAPDQSQLAPVPIVAPRREYPCSEKQELVSTVYCNRCEQKFMSLKLLDKHYWSQHPNVDIPLDLVFKVGSGDVTPRLTPCSVCAKRTACVKAIQQLLDEAISDLETVH